MYKLLFFAVFLIGFGLFLLRKGLGEDLNDTTLPLLNKYFIRGLISTLIGFGMLIAAAFQHLS